MGYGCVLLYVIFATNIPLKNYLKYTFSLNFSSGFMGSEGSLPKTQKAMENLGFNQAICNLIAPFGTNMSVVGTSLLMGLYFHFLGGNVDIFSLKFVSLVLISVPRHLMLAPGVPFVNGYILSALLISTGGSPELVGIILGIDRILDIFFTTLNVNWNILTVYEVSQNRRGFFTYFFRKKQIS